MNPRRAKTPLNCMDKAMLALDCGDERMLLHWVIALSGGVDPAGVRFALTTVAARHPVLRSTVHTGLRRQFRETQDFFGHDPLTVIDAPSPSSGAGERPDGPSETYDSLLSAWMNRPLDTAREPPWRVLLLRRSASDCSLVFTFHHSATDGLGALRLVTEVIRRYNGAPEEPPPPAAGGDRLLALARACGRTTRHFRIKMAASLCQRFLATPVARHGRVCRAATTPAPDFYFCHGTLNHHEVAQIKKKSRTLGGTVNDVLIAACFETVDQWNDVHGLRSGRIDIMVPVDLGQSMPPRVTENRVSFISISTTREQRASRDGLLRIVTRKTSAKLRDGIAFSIVYAASFWCRLPPLIPKAVARFLLATRLYLDSMLVTNLGPIWPRGIDGIDGDHRIGAAVITGVVVIPPVVSPMGVSLSAGTYHSRLQVALAYKTSQFSHAQARLFLNLYLHELRNFQRTAEGTLSPQVTKRLTPEAAQAR